MIVPGVETAEEWEEFRVAIVAGYAPEGPLETELADRIAHQLWRLRRFSRYEADRAAWRMRLAAYEFEQARSEATRLAPMAVAGVFPTGPHFYESMLRTPRWNLELARYYASPAAAEEPGDADQDEAGAMLRCAASVAGLDADRVVPDKDREGWRVDEVRAHLARMAALARLPVEELLGSVVARFEAEVAAVEASQAKAEAALSEFKRTLTLPTEAEIRNASRWESHLERSLCRMMDRLERLQRMRAGEFVAAPALVEVSADRQ